MSYSIDANILLYASNTDAPEHERAFEFLKERVNETDLLCLTWPVVMAYQRIATHPRLFRKPLSASAAWENIHQLIKLPRCRMIREESSFAKDYEKVAKGLQITGNLVPDAHIATILRQHGVNSIYTADSDFRKFDFLKVVNPLKN